MGAFHARSTPMKPSAHPEVAPFQTIFPVYLVNALIWPRLSRPIH